MVVEFMEGGETEGRRTGGREGGRETSFSLLASCVYFFFACSACVFCGHRTDGEREGRVAFFEERRRVN